MATIWEETRTQNAKMKDRPFKEKIAYFFEYYKIHTLVVIVVICFLFSFIKAVVTNKDYALSVIMINSLGDSFESVIDGYEDSIASRMEFDEKKYAVVIDTSLYMGMDNTAANMEYASMQKIAAMISSKSVDILVANTAIFEQYSQNQYFYDLRSLYTDEELDKYSDYIYYTDASTFKDYEEENVGVDTASMQAGYTVNHHDPESMADPIPCGFFLTEDSPLTKDALFSHYSDSNIFQGYKEEAVIGILINSPRVDQSVIGTNFFLGE